MSARDGAIAFLCPVAPSDRGNGLAMRAGLFLEGLASVAPVELVVVPIYTAPLGGDAFAARHAHARWTPTLAGPQDRDWITGMLATAAGRQRAGALHPLPGVCRHPDAASRARLDELLARVGLVHVMRSFLTPWVDGLLDRAGRPPVTLDFDELDSGVCAQLGEAEEARRFARLERSCARRVDQSYTASAADALAIGQDPAAAPVGVVPNAVRRPAAPPPPPDGAGPSYDLLFVGNLSYAPNVDAVRWLCGELRSRLGGASIAIVGSAPGAAVRSLGELDGVTVAADVAEVAGWYAAARVAVVPLRLGGGTRTKIVEALAHGRPVVSTTLGASGLPSGEERGVLVTDDADAFAAACRALLGDPGRARRVAAAGRPHVVWADDVREVVAARTRAVIARHRSGS